MTIKMSGSFVAKDQAYNVHTVFWTAVPLDASDGLNTDKIDRGVITAKTARGQRVGTHNPPRRFHYFIETPDGYIDIITTDPEAPFEPFFLD